LDVLNRDYPKGTLEPIIAEVNECLDTDVIIKRIARDKRVPVEDLRFDFRKNTEATLSLSNLWLQILDDSYGDTLEAEILHALSRPKLKKKLLICTKLFVANLLSSGTHREFILSETDRFFFEKDIGQCTDAMAKRFLAIFNGAQKDFTIIFTANKELADIFSVGPKLMRADSLEQVQAKTESAITLEQEITEDHPAIIFEAGKSRDAFSALRKTSIVYSMPDVFQTVYPSPNEMSFDDECIVLDSKSKNFWAINRRKLTAPVHSFTSKIEYSQQNFIAFLKYTLSPSESENGVDFLKLQNSLETAHAALISENAATQLVTLWSAFEALLPSPTREEKSVRIKHFVDFIVPCVSRRYIRGKFRIFIDDCAQHFGGDIEKIIGGTSRLERPRLLASLLLDDSPERRNIFAAINESPLLMQRLFELGKLMEDPSRIRAKQLAHENRVAWQLNRIYRERNLIVHSGRSSDCLPILVENLFLYYRLVLRALQYTFSRYGLNRTDSALELVAALHGKRQRRFDEIIRNTNDRNFRENYLVNIFGD
jgi:hypothetical protein